MTEFDGSLLLSILLVLFGFIAYSIYRCRVDASKKQKLKEKNMSGELSFYVNADDIEKHPDLEEYYNKIYDQRLGVLLLKMIKDIDRLNQHRLKLEGELLEMQCSKKVCNCFICERARRNLAEFKSAEKEKCTCYKHGPRCLFCAREKIIPSDCHCQRGWDIVYCKASGSREWICPGCKSLWNDKAKGVEF